MKIENQTQIEVKGDQLESITATIDTDKMYKMFSILSNLYRNVLGSCIREYTSNCFDSHIEAGVDDPVIIRKETDKEGNTVLCFQDVGVGLSPERVRNIFMSYGSSTKEDTNDQIGGFGLGSKSGLAYQKSMIIDTIYNGVSYSYILHKGEAELPTLEKLFELPTTERNGTTIRLRIKPQDEGSVRSQLMTQLTYFDNVYIEGYAFSNEYKLYESKYFKFRDRDSGWVGVHLVLGKVAYQINFDEIGHEFRTKIPIGIKFEIGELQVTPSREDIIYSKQAKELIKERIELAYEELAERYNSTVVDCDNLADYFENRNNPTHLIIDKTNHLASINLQEISDRLKKVTYTPLGKYATLYHFPKNINSLKDLFPYIPITHLWNGEKFKEDKYSSTRRIDSDTKFILKKEGERVSGKYFDIFCKEYIKKSGIRHYYVVRSSYRIVLNVMLVKLGLPHDTRYSFVKPRIELLKVLRDCLKKEMQPYFNQLVLSVQDITPSEQWIADYKKENANPVAVGNVYVQQLSSYGNIGYSNMSLALLQSKKKLVVATTEQKEFVELVRNIINNRKFNTDSKKWKISKWYDDNCFIIASREAIKEIKKSKITFKTVEEYIEELPSVLIETIIANKYYRFKEAHPEIKKVVEVLEYINPTLYSEFEETEDKMRSLSQVYVPDEIRQFCIKKAAAIGYTFDENIPAIATLKKVLTYYEKAPLIELMESKLFYGTERSFLRKKENVVKYLKSCYVRLDSSFYNIYVPAPQLELELTENQENDNKEVD